jgi:hypothetical protein
MRGIFREPPIFVRSGVRWLLERDISSGVLDRKRKLLGLEETSVITSNSCEYEASLARTSVCDAEPPYLVKLPIKLGNRVSKINVSQAVIN